MKNKNNEDIIVFMDEDATYCVIAGTDDKVEAEKALRETELEWFGEGYENAEGKMNMDDFGLVDMLEGERDGETYYYWGKKSDKKIFDKEYKLIKGFMAYIS